MARKKFPIGIQDFEKIINGNYTYVDKTDLLYKLVSEGSSYFLSRPRRFGKSLLVSTLEYYFSGKKELFAGLKIEELEEDWQKYPVFRLDFSGKNYKNEKSLVQHINAHLEEWESVYGNEKQNRDVDERLRYIIRRAFERAGMRVVVLVDEYDKPLLDVINDEKLDMQFRSLLKGFYGVLKSSDEFLKFVLLTGVTKFSKVSVFSDLNQLQDISLDDEYSTLCGITEEELESYFKEDIKLLADKNAVSYSNMLKALRHRYDGYHFSEASVGVYNPFSILNVFAKLSLRDYWFQTGTPTFLLDLLKQTHFDIVELEGVRMDANDISNYRAESNNPVPIIYQAGYLTIKGYDVRRNRYTLGYPNAEVKNGFLKFIAPSYMPPISKSAFSIDGFMDDIEAGNVEAFMVRLKSMIAAMDYTLFDKELKEKYFQTIFYLVFSMVGALVHTEVHTSNGSIDAVVESDKYIYVFEFKMDKSVEEALTQIETKCYANRYLSDSRKVMKIGANFNSATHQLEAWQIGE